MWTVCKEPDTEDVKSTSSDMVAVQPLKFAKVDVRAVTQHDDKDDGDDDGENCAESEDLVLRIVRGAGVGLGMSVAGGVGTTPFREDDEVGCLRCVFVYAGSKSNLKAICIAPYIVN